MDRMTILSKPDAKFNIVLIGILISSFVLFSNIHYFGNENKETDKSQIEQTEQAKTSGKNGKHANQKARQSAKEKYLECKKQYDELSRKPNKTPDDKKRLQKLYNQLKKWKKQADFKGENHSQKAKGN